VIKHQSVTGIECLGWVITRRKRWMHCRSGCRLRRGENVVRRYLVIEIKTDTYMQVRRLREKANPTPEAQHFVSSEDLGTVSMINFRRSAMALHYGEQCEIGRWLQPSGTNNRGRARVRQTEPLQPVTKSSIGVFRGPPRSLRLTRVP
jgi:hypothetical protein